MTPHTPLYSWLNSEWDLIIGTSLPPLNLAQINTIFVLSFLILASRENEIYQSEHFLSFLSDLANATSDQHNTKLIWNKCVFDQFFKKYILDCLRQKSGITPGCGLMIFETPVITIWSRSVLEVVLQEQNLQEVSLYIYPLCKNAAKTNAPFWWHRF